MDAHPAGLYDPKRPLQFVQVKHRQQVADPLVQSSRRSPRTGLQDNDARSVLRRKPKDVAEVMIERDQCSAFLLAFGKDHVVGCTSKPFAAHCRNIMPGSNQQRLAVGATSCRAIGIMRSHAISAPVGDGAHEYPPA